MELDELVHNIRSARDEASAALAQLAADLNDPDTESSDTIGLNVRFAAARAVEIALSRVLGEEPPERPIS